ncbi:redox-regulated ATPase YchF [Candidatus Saccharibacteria bacterium]|nr:redox-regulated ATPase YchF [Candidatus Saccharibacteria bacterium]
MSLSIGIVGLPNVGKSTLFNALTDSNILAANYPFATIEPNTGIVPVPDARLSKLSEMYSGAPIKPATVTFVDIAGLVAGASQGEGLGNKFLANIRECDAIIHVVRAFEDGNVQHVDETHDPKKDIETINTELILADLQTIDGRLPKLAKEAKADPKKRAVAGYLETLKRHLDEGTPLSALPSLDHDIIRDLHLLTAKPVIYAFNVDESTLTNSAKQHELTSLVAPAQSVFICAKLEEELRGLDTTEAAELLESYGVTEPGLVQLIHAAYDTLGLQSYLTAGEKEVRAWTVHKGATAPQAAGVIHGDFEKGFIAAQIVDYDDLIAAGSEQAAKAAGKVRTEGKDYVMQPGDIVEFRFNVSK